MILSERSLEIALYVCGSGFLLSGVLAYFTWAIWIHRYVQMYGERPTFFLWGWAPIVDYRKARRICRRFGERKIWFLTAYRRLEIAAFVFFVAGLCIVVGWVFVGPS